MLPKFNDRVALHLGDADANPSYDKAGGRIFGLEFNQLNRMLNFVWTQNDAVSLKRRITEG